jgi:hypothetical protein
MPMVMKMGYAPSAAGLERIAVLSAVGRKVFLILLLAAISLLTSAGSGRLGGAAAAGRTIGEVFVVCLQDARQLASSCQGTTIYFARATRAAFSTK